MDVVGNVREEECKKVSRAREREQRSLLRAAQRLMVGLQRRRSAAAVPKARARETFPRRAECLSSLLSGFNQWMSPETRRTLLQSQLTAVRDLNLFQ
jgi:hypothetical protein